MATFATVFVVVNEGRVAELLRSPGGAVMSEMAVMAKISATSARRRVPRKTGELARSIDWRISGLGVEVFADTPYAFYVEQGTRPHRIVARNTRVLRWVPKNQSTPVYRPSVRHPGAKPKPFLRKAVEAGMWRHFGITIQLV